MLPATFQVMMMDILKHGRWPIEQFRAWEVVSAAVKLTQQRCYRRRRTIWTAKWCKFKQVLANVVACCILIWELSGSCLFPFCKTDSLKFAILKIYDLISVIQCILLFSCLMLFCALFAGLAVFNIMRVLHPPSQTDCHPQYPKGHVFPWLFAPPILIFFWQNWIQNKMSRTVVLVNLKGVSVCFWVFFCARQKESVMLQTKIGQQAKARGILGFAADTPGLYCCWNAGGGEVSVW